jgi:uncharacterized OsmC-like protein
MMNFRVEAHRVDSSESFAITKQAQLVMSTGMANRDNAFNPVELLLASLAACMIKGIERVTPTLGFHLESLTVELDAARPDTEARIDWIRYRILVETNEEDRRLELLHDNVMKFGTIYNTLTKATNLTGTLERTPQTRA